MSIVELYVGDLDDPNFGWDRYENLDTNQPGQLSPVFPPVSGGSFGALNKFDDWVKRSGCETKATDWGTRVARVTKSQIRDFIAFCFDDDPHYNDPEQMLTWEGKPYLVDKLNRLREFVETLRDHEVYRLVVADSAQRLAVIE